LELEDELRVALRSRGFVWGFMCLHRGKGSVFSAEEVGFTKRIAVASMIFALRSSASGAAGFRIPEAVMIDSRLRPDVQIVWWPHQRSA
jgi:hypothetical protein